MTRLLLVALISFVASTSAGGADTLPPEKLAAIKKATVFVLVDNGTDGGTGSGFLVRADGTTGYIATNHHVVSLSQGPLRRGIPRDTVVAVVFDSGLPTERLIKGEVVAEDPEHDLAMIRIRNVKDLPKPLDVTDPPKLIETMTVLVCGFPFGETLSTNRKKMPNITIGKATISSVRNNETGNVSVVQLDGALNPGNSGGPILTTDGKLAGVAVASILGANIGLAIPHQQLQTMMNGTVGQPAIRATPVDANTVELKIDAPLVDPFGQVKALTAQYRSGDGKANATKLETAAMTIRNGWGTAKVRLPRGGATTFSVQFQVTRATGTGLSESPFSVTVPSFPKTATAKDAKNLSSVTAATETVSAGPLGKKAVTLKALQDTPERFLGSRTSIEALLGHETQPNAGTSKLEVYSDPTTRVRKLDFMAVPSLASQVSQLTEQRRVRLTGTLSVPESARKNYVFDVEEIGLLNEDGTVEEVLRPDANAIVPVQETTAIVKQPEPTPTKPEASGEKAAAKTGKVPTMLIIAAIVVGMMMVGMMIVGVKLMKYLPGKPEQQPRPRTRKHSRAVEESFAAFDHASSERGDDHE